MCVAEEKGFVLRESWFRVLLLMNGTIEAQLSRAEAQSKKRTIGIAE